MPPHDGLGGPCRPVSRVRRRERPDHNYCKHCGTPLRAVDVERELGSGFAERTRDRCLQLLKADPENPGTHYNLGLAYYHLGQIGNAIRAFDKCVAKREFEDAILAAADPQSRQILPLDPYPRSAKGAR